ncbi:3,4-dihydroxy-2-butanone-4-phosphate synthase [Sorangium sp. So ce426]
MAVSTSTLRVQAAVEQLRSGGMVILVDDEAREDEGDLVVLAEHATPAAINFMATHGRGLICLALTEDQVDRLALPTNGLKPREKAGIPQGDGEAGSERRQEGEIHSFFFLPASPPPCENSPGFNVLGVLGSAR